MKKNIILVTSVILLCLAISYIFNTRIRYMGLKNKYELQEKEIKNLVWKLYQLNEVAEKRKVRIKQLTSGYPAGIWECDSNADRIVFKQKIEDPTLPEIFAKLNEANKFLKQPTIILLKQNKNIVHLSVNDSEQLTERMGSAGAKCYLGEVVYSITSIDGIDAVIFEFEEGSHARPGRYGRIDFEP